MQWWWLLIRDSWAVYQATPSSRAGNLRHAASSPGLDTCPCGGRRSQVLSTELYGNCTERRLASSEQALITRITMSLAVATPCNQRSSTYWRQQRSASVLRGHRSHQLARIVALTSSCVNINTPSPRHGTAEAVVVGPHLFHGKGLCDLAANPMAIQRDGPHLLHVGRFRRDFLFRDQVLDPGSRWVTSHLWCLP